jgi:hypothetical protein
MISASSLLSDPFSNRIVRPSSTASPLQAPAADVASECDWCGRAVRPETAHRRVHHTDDGVQVVVLCSDCELGAD